MKKNLRKIALGVLTALFAICCGAITNVAPTANAEETSATSPITWLYTPSSTDFDGENPVASQVNYKTGWNNTATIEEYSSSPTGNVLHHTIDYTAKSSEAYPYLKVNLPYDGTFTDTEKANGGYVMWIEYTGEIYTNNSSLYALFAHDFGSASNAFKSINGKPFTWVNEYGKITSSVPKRSSYHHENYTAIEGTEYTYAYSYSYKGYVLMPFSTLHNSASIPNASTYMRFQQNYNKFVTMDLKIGGIGFYTDYNATVNDLERFSYEFLGYEGEVVASGLAKAGETIEAPKPEPFTKDGKVYTFVGWAGYTEGMTISSDTTFNAVYKVSDFKMVKGASIRTNVGTSGIRFAAEFDEDLYNEVLLDDNKEFGMIITKLDYYNEALKLDKDLIAGLNLYGNNKYVWITESTANPLIVYRNVEETNVTYRINGAITNIKYDHADWKWIGIGVVITTDEETGEKSYLYAAHDTENARTAAYVASAALNDPTKTYTSTQKDTIKNYVYKTAAIQAGKSETEFNATEDKASYLANYSLSIGEGLEVVETKLNNNVAGDEAYLEIGYTKDLETVVSDENGNVLDIACTISSSNPSVLSVNGSTIKVEKNGYSAVSINCELFGISEFVNVYTGSEDAGNRKMGSNTGAANGSTSGTDGVIANQTYDWTQGATDDGQKLYAGYTDISLYYIDYLISQGYKYLRIPFYFDTTRWADLGATSADQVTTPYFTIWMAKQLDGTSGGSSKKVYVPANEWCYYDMDLNHYRWNFAEVDYAGVDNYGFKTKITDGGWYHYMNMKFSCAYGYVHVGKMTFLKESVLNVNVNSNEISFGENVSLSDIYTTKEAVKYTVDGVEIDKLTAISANHNVEIKANIYTAVIGDGTYTIGNSSAWSIGCNEVAPIEKTMTVKDGLEVEGTTLVDVKDVTTDTMSISSFTGKTQLENAGFDVTQTYVKRYSDGTEQTTDTIASTERGIYYATVSATNGTQTIEYDVTLDFYNSNEPVEYESFGHGDSSYAVKLWYYLSGALTGSGKTSYEYITKTYPEGSTGMSMSVGDGYVSLKAYGDNSLDGATNANVLAVYGNTNISYVAIDQSKISPEGPLVKDMGNATSAINIYVTPRHTKEYYEMYAESNTGVIKYAYAAGWSARPSGVSGDQQTKRYSLQNVNNGVATLTYKDAWSAAWQQWAYANQNITLSKLVDNYEAFWNNDFPIYISEDPHGRNQAVPNNGVAKLGSILF